MVDKLEGEDALFGESTSGSDYDTEEALSQPITDDGSVVPGEEVVNPSRHVPRRRRDQSPVNVRSGSSLRPQRCLTQGCDWPARVRNNFDFCSRTCGRKVGFCPCFMPGLFSDPRWVSLFQKLDGTAFRADRSPIGEANCARPGCPHANLASEGHKYCSIE